jgi:hypothetical protein
MTEMVLAPHAVEFKEEAVRLVLAGKEKLAARPWRLFGLRIRDGRGTVLRNGLFHPRRREEHNHESQIQGGGVERGGRDVVARLETAAIS